MTARDLFEAIGLVEDALILEADAPQPARPQLIWLRRALPLAACLCVVVSGAVLAFGNLRMGGHSAAPDNASAGAAPIVLGDTPEAVDSFPAPQEAPSGETAPQGNGGADAKGAELYGVHSTESPVRAVDPEDPQDGAGAALLYDGELDSVIVSVFWAQGEPEAMTELKAQASGDAAQSAPMAPAWLPVYRGSQLAGYYEGLAKDATAALELAQTLLDQGVYIQGGPAQSDMAVELVYSPIAAQVRIPFYAFTAEVAGETVWCYVPALAPQALQTLLDETAQ